MVKDQIHNEQLEVVILTSRYPYPLDKGDKLRIYNHIKELSKYVKITLICLHEKPLTTEAIAALSPYCTEVHSFRLSKYKMRLGAFKYFLSGQPMQVGYFYNSDIKQRIDWIIDELKPDHVHCHMVRMIPYVTFRKPITYSLDYMDSMVLNDMASQHITGFGLGLLRYLERRRIAAFEFKSHGNFQSHFIISLRDRIQMYQECQADISLLSNGVVVNQKLIGSDNEKIYDLCFCGNLGYGPNQKAIDIILNDILPRLKPLSMVIAGAEVSSDISNRVEAGLSILSPVDNMSDVYRKSRVLIAPIFTGSGQQNKILEAMALGVPCITTSFVNESIDANNGDEIIIAEDPNSFIESVKVLLSQPELYARISKNAADLVERRFNWARNSKPLIEAVLNSRNNE